MFVIDSCSSKKMNGTLDHPDQPDIDAIKMFVGQVPRSWSEKDLRDLFEQYGAVYEINVLRDRSQNPPQSKGESPLFSFYWRFWSKIIMRLLDTYYSEKACLCVVLISRSMHDLHVTAFALVARKADSRKVGLNVCCSSHAGANLGMSLHVDRFIVELYLHSLLIL